MASTSYINTGVLGNITGGSLGTTGLTAGAQYQEFAEGVKRRKRRLSGPSQAERRAVAERRSRRQDASLRDTARQTTTEDGKTIIEERLSAPVDTADVKVPDVQVKPTDTPETKAIIEESTKVGKTAGITKSPDVKPAPAPREPVLHPGRDYSESDAAFVRAFVDLQQRVGSKVGTGRVKGAAGSISSDYQNVVNLAKATGNEAYIGYASELSGSLYAGQSSISAGNIGTAAGSLNKNVGALRNTLDLDYLLAQPVAPKTPNTNIVGNALKSTIRRGFSGFGGVF